MRAVFTEYFWNMGWCDPCAANPLTVAELKQLGVFWLGSSASNNSRGRGIPVQVTRLHIRYTPDTFPEDLMFQETADNQNFQGRYVLRHSWSGNPEQCEAAETYFENLTTRHEEESRVLSELTGWDLNKIRKKMNLNDTVKPTTNKWWDNIWKK